MGSGPLWSSRPGRGVNLKLRTIILDSDFTEIRLTNSTAFWVKEFIVYDLNTKARHSRRAPHIDYSAFRANSEHMKILEKLSKKLRTEREVEPQKRMQEKSSEEAARDKSSQLMHLARSQRLWNFDDHAGSLAGLRRRPFIVWDFAARLVRPGTPRHWSGYYLLLFVVSVFSLELLCQLLHVDKHALHSGLSNDKRLALVKEFNTPGSSLRVLIIMYKVSAASVNLDRDCHHVLVKTYSENVAIETQAWARLIRVRETLSLTRHDLRVKLYD